MGNHRHPTADSQNERRRSANLARANAPAHRKRLAHLPDRKTHAVELQGLNGLSFALTLNRYARPLRMLTDRSLAGGQLASRHSLSVMFSLPCRAGGNALGLMIGGNHIANIAL